MERERERVYLTDAHKFEQSLDIYYPINLSNKRIPINNTNPIVIITIGSGWLGHTPLIYMVTAWWNESLAKKLTKQGIPCIYIRHRGACIHPSIWVYILNMFLMFITNMQIEMFIGTFFIFGLCSWVGRGSATYQNMIDDTADSLKYIYNKRIEISKKCNSNGKFIIGGYSSGSHILLSVLQNGLLEKRGMPSPDKIYDSILLISGVYSTGKFDKAPENIHYKIIKAFLTNIFKCSPNNQMSPIHNIKLLPKLPYLIIKCKHEVWNMPLIARIFDILLCGKEFIEKMNKCSDKNSIKLFDIKSIELNENHWSILNSNVLIDFICMHIK
jgi:hypothetical protein